MAFSDRRIKFAILLACFASLIGYAISQPIEATLSVELKQASIPRTERTQINEIYYYVETFVGDPLRKFKAVFAINSDVSILPRTNSTNHIDGLYNPRQSNQSLVQSLNCVSKSNRHEFEGMIYRDRMSLDYDHQPLRGFPFYFMPTYKTSEFSELVGRKYDAMIGLKINSHESLARVGFLETLQASGLIGTKRVSVSFEGKNKPGKLLFGATNSSSSYEGELTMHKSNNLREFKVDLDRVLLGSHVLSTRAEVGFDLSISDLVGHRQQVSEIHRLLGVDVSNGLATFPKATIIADLPTLTFVISGKQYAYPPEIYVNQFGNVTYLAIRSSIDESASNGWKFGTDFMSIYYTTFDMTARTVGIAPMARH